jgi:hypothetical protein
MKKCFFEDLPFYLQQAVAEIARWCIDTEDLQDDIREYGLDTVLTEAIDDAINRHNTAKKPSEWIKFAEEINHYK